MIKILSYSILFLSCFCFSQNKSFEIYGILKSKRDSTTLPIDNATIYTKRIKDTTLVSYTISDTEGRFTLEGESKDSIVGFYISHTIYNNYYKEINVKKGNIDLGDIYLKEKANVLDEVLIKEAPPVVIKKDTIEFNPKLFKLKRGGKLEDLLKALPGVSVDKDGGIKVNGKSISRITVNSKPFFDYDQTIVTTNVPKDIVEKLQVVEGGSRINLEIDEDDISKGFFFKLLGGLGTDERYKSTAALNYFDPKQQFSIVPYANNISQNITNQASLDNFKIGPQTGINTYDGVRFNYNRVNTERVNFKGNYQYKSDEILNGSIAKSLYFVIFFHKKIVDQGYN